MCSPGFFLLVGNENFELVSGIFFGLDQSHEFLETLLGLDCLFSVELAKLVVGDEVGLFLEVEKDLADLQPEDVVLVVLVALLGLLGLHVRLHLLLVLEHFLVVLIVFPGLLQLLVLLAVDVVEREFGQHVCSLLDFGEEGEDVVLELELVETPELEVQLGQVVPVPSCYAAYSRKNLSLPMSAFTQLNSILDWSQ